MKNKLIFIFTACAAFTGFFQQQLQAVSATPEILVVAMQKFNGNALVLSTNTLGINLDADISAEVGTDEQLVGYVEWNATKQGAVSQGVVLSQLEQYTASNGGCAVGLFAGTIPTKGNTTLSDDLVTSQAIKIYTNVDTTSTTTAVYIQPVQLSSTASGSLRSANITTATTDTFSGMIGVLSFYAVDADTNATTAGTYTANFLFTIQTQ